LTSSILIRRGVVSGYHQDAVDSFSFEERDVRRGSRSVALAAAAVHYRCCDCGNPLDWPARTVPAHAIAKASRLSAFLGITASGAG
jgi:hypothetical protein